MIKKTIRDELTGLVTDIEIALVKLWNDGDQDYEECVGIIEEANITAEHSDDGYWDVKYADSNLTVLNKNGYTMIPWNLSEKEMKRLTKSLYEKFGFIAFFKGEELEE